MTEGLFILTTIFVAYVVYVIIGDSKAAKSKTKAAPAPVKKPKPRAPKPRASKPAATKTVSASRTASSSKPKPAVAEVAAASDVKELRNPKTGEISAIASNYRFMKRWIKDALVSENLLDKVYKNNDIDDAADAKIKIALEKIKTLKKYQA